jgi:precorrin-4/cobalt-precorrin-4 C11-methyltransferase
MRELAKQGVAYEVIPGVTAAFAASAKMNMEFTLPELTQTLILTRISGRTPVPETEALEKLAAHKAALAVYLSIGHVESVQKVIETHYGKRALCAIAYKVSHPDEQILIVPACELAKACHDKRITRHALIIAGRCVAASCKEKGQGTDKIKSKLYDAGFFHGYRAAQK